MPLNESPNHPNENGSRVLAIITILAIPISYIVHILFGKGLDINLFLFIPASLVCLLSAVINFFNTFETNKSWKAYLAYFAVVAVLLVTVIPIATHNAQ